MSLTVTQRPNNPTGWNAVGNPVIYKMQRKDYTFNQINNSGGAIQLQFNSVNIASSFTSGDIIYLQSDNGVYDLLVNVNSSTFSSPNTLVLCQEDYISAAPGGFVNNETTRESYRIEVEVYDSGNNLLNEQPLEISPTSKGVIQFDIKRVLRYQMLPDNDADLTGSTEVFDDTNVYIKFYIKYREVWIGSAESQTSDSGNQFFATFGARQLSDRPTFPARWGDMNEYVEGAEVEVLNDTAFDSNWTNQAGLGASWTLGATALSVNIDAEDTQRVRRLVTLDASKAYSFNLIGSLSLGGASVNLIVYLGGTQPVNILTNENASGAFNVTQITLTSSAYTYIEVYAFDSDTDTITIDDIVISELSTNLFLTKFDTLKFWRGWPCLLGCIISDQITDNVYLSVTDTTTPADYSEKVISFDLNQIVSDQTVSTLEATVYADATTDYPISETKAIQLVDACDNPVMLLGRNSLGGPLQWMFDVNQEYTFDYGNGIKAARKVLTAVNLSLNEWESLQDFITLGEVYKNNIFENNSTFAAYKTSTRIGQQVYVLDADGNKTGVLVIPTVNTTRTKQKKHVFEIEIEYPEVITI